ncbi:MAG: phosphoribosylglycinamide formyltransferase [Planctomycetota bacterium]|nr:MAG: phosphoribosylglycinamide formyltransferase [Planctomycetota bacterium]
MTKKLRLAVLVSGSGRTMQNFIDLSDKGELPVEVVCCVSSDPKAKGVERAKNHDIPVETFLRRDYGSTVQYSDAIYKWIEQYDPDYVALAGYLKLLHIPEEYENRIINIHPALLPSFGGDHFYGHLVHEAVLKRGCKVSGCSVHFVDKVYDHGPIIVQRTCPVHAFDTPDDLADRVFEQELIAFPEALKLIAEGRVEVRDGKVYIDGK